MPMLMYSQSTSGSTQPKEKAAIACYGNVLSTWQYYIMGHATEEDAVSVTQPTVLKYLRKISNPLLK